MMRIREYAIYANDRNIVLAELRNGAPISAILDDADTVNGFDKCLAAIDNGNPPFGAVMLYGKDAAKTCSTCEFVCSFEVSDNGMSIMKSDAKQIEDLKTDWIANASFQSAVQR